MMIFELPLWADLCGAAIMAAILAYVFVKGKSKK